MPSALEILQETVWGCPPLFALDGINRCSYFGIHRLFCEDFSKDKD